MEEVKKVAKGFVREEAIPKSKRKVRKPECFGDFENCKRQRCRFKKGHCQEEQAKRKRSEERKNRLSYKFFLIKEFIKSLFTVRFWIMTIQRVEPLLEVIFIDALVLILLGGVGFTFYFLSKGNWKMTLCSIAAFLAVALVLERTHASHSDARSYVPPEPENEGEQK